MTRPVIVLEFNELTPALIERFIDAGDLPGFARLRSESVVSVTDAEERAPNLEPWIQWVTVHTGLSFQEHGVFLLGDGAKLAAPRIWDVVADAGERAWICGSMNSAITARRRENLFLLPDPWAVDVAPSPPGEFEAYFNFVRAQVQEYTRDRAPLRATDLARFVGFMVGAGLSPRTVADTVRQLAGEFQRGTRWRRAPILDRLQWDVFRHFYRKLRPAFSTFFVNSTAHYQHFYWRHMEPERFTHSPQPGRDVGAAEAIRFGYQRMDRIVQEVLALAGDEATVVLCTALSGQPLLKYEAVGGKQIIRVTAIERLLDYLGVEGAPAYAPVMSEEFHLVFASAADAQDAETRLTSLHAAAGEPVMAVQRQGADLLCGVKLMTMPPAEIEATSRFSNRPAPFGELFYLAQDAKSGMHHPDGVFWVRTPSRRHQRVQRKVPLREVAPTLLALSGVPTDHRFPAQPLPELADAITAPAGRQRALEPAGV
jgi:hypothetical protein